MSCRDEVSGQYQKLAREDKIKFWESVVGNVEHECVDDFLIAEGIAFKVKSSPSVILHLPSGLWRGFALPYDVALEMLRNDKEGHAELLAFIYEA